MKLKLLSTLIISLLSFTSVFASFPVVKTVNHATEVTVSSSENKEEALSSPAAASNYNKWIAVALWFFLGGFAAHRWYAGKPVGWNILFIFTLGGLGVWAIIDLINILTDNFE